MYLASWRRTRRRPSRPPGRLCRLPAPGGGARGLPELLATATPAIPVPDALRDRTSRCARRPPGPSRARRGPRCRRLRQGPRRPRSQPQWPRRQPAGPGGGGAGWWSRSPRPRWWPRWPSRERCSWRVAAVSHPADPGGGGGGGGRGQVTVTRTAGGRSFDVRIQGCRRRLRLVVRAVGGLSPGHSGAPQRCRSAPSRLPPTAAPA